MGPAGVASNLQSRRRASGSNVQSKTENIKTSYLVPKTEETQTNTTPVRNFMTVSVLVNSAADGVKQEDGAIPPGLDQRVTAIVKNAVGFQDDSDTISVEFLPFPGTELSLEPVAPPFNWVALDVADRECLTGDCRRTRVLVGAVFAATGATHSRAR